MQRGKAECHPVITVSTDGSCLRNPGGAIGWAWANHDGTHGSGAVAAGTNQIAELMAVLEAITSHPGDEPLCIEADSQYAIKCASEWVHGWRRKGWRTAASMDWMSARFCTGPPAAAAIPCASTRPPTPTRT